MDSVSGGVNFLFNDAVKLYNTHPSFYITIKYKIKKKGEVLKIGAR